MIPTRNFDLLERFTTVYPGNNVLSEKKGGKWTFYTSEQYSEIAHNFALGLLKMGFSKGDKIMTVTNNRPQWNFVDMGMALAGVVHVPVYTSLNDQEYGYVMDHSDSSMLIISDQKLYNLILPEFRKQKKAKHIYTFDQIDGAAHWSEVVELGKTASEEIRQKLETTKTEVVPEDLVSIIYTSGTTGQAKGVMLSHKNLVSNFLAASKVFQLTSEDRYLAIIPV